MTSVTPFGGPSGILISQAVTFNAADFTGNGTMTWTVAAGDVTTFRYAIQGKVMTVWLRLVSSTVGGVADSRLRVKIPASRTASHEIVANFLAAPGGLTTEGIIAFIQPSVDATLIQFLRFARS